MKHFQKIRKLMAALMVVVLLIASVPTAFAASFSAYVTASSMAVYSDASLSEKLGSLSKYTVVTVKDYSGGVAKISYNGRTGYAKASNMKSVESVAKVAYLNDTAKAYKSASTSGASMKVAAGTKVNVIAINGGWALVEKGGVGAYIQTKYLSDTPYTNPILTASPTPTAEPTNEPTNEPEAIARAVVNAKAKVYKKADADSASTTVAKGTKVEVIAVNGDWAYIRNANGVYAYIYKKYLSDPDAATAEPTAEPTEEPTPVPTSNHQAIVAAVVNADAKVYKKADTDSDSTTVKAGTKVSVIAINGDWAYIRNANGVYAYIYKKYLSDPNAATAEPTVKPTEEPQAIARAVVNAKAKVYKKASTDSASTTVAKGTKVEIIATNGDWAYIRNANGTYAYINKKYLSDPDAATAEPTAEPTEEPTPVPTANHQAITAAVLNANAKVYRKADTDSASMTVKAGTKVSVIATNGDWAYIRSAGGTYAYINKKYLSDPNATPTPTIEPTSEPEAIAVAVVNAKAKVYKKASTSSASATVKAGTKVEVIAVDGDWAYIRSSGGTYAYINKKHLSDPNATPEPTATPDVSEAIPATVTASSVKVYKKANTSSTVLGTLEKGTQLNVMDYSNGWAYVELNGNYGYCKLSALTKNSDLVDAEYKTLDKPVEAVTVSSAKVYEKANTGSPELGTIPKGKEVSVLAYTTDGKLAKIQLGDQAGWCALSALEIVKKDPLEGYTKETFGATVVTTGAKLYEVAGEGDGTAIPFGADVTVGAYSSQWAYVRYGDKYGFMPVSALSRASFAALTKGSTGSSVSTLEKALLAGGYFDAVPDSTYDAATVAAVQRFQAACGLTQSGEASQSLQRMLYSGNGPESSLLSSSLSRGDTGANVTRVQNRLYALGYLSKTSSLDGDFGTTTAAAITLFQSCNGVSVSGGCNSTTLRKLYSTSANKLPSGKTPADVITSPNVTDGSQTSNSTNISSSLASTTDTYSSSMSNSQKLEYMIYKGQNQLGKPYVYGATGTSSYDCSGFTYYCYKQINVTLKRTAQMQGYDDTYTKIESVSGLRRGDLVFFNTVSSDSDSCDHAGVYLGSGWFIHASSGQAKVVVSNLSSGYYNRVFSWGRRILG